MELTKEEGRMLVWGDLEGWEEIEQELVDTTRWSIIYSGVFQHTESGKFYQTSWSRGATESQDEGPFEYDAPELTEVELVEITTKVFRAVKNGTED